MQTTTTIKQATARNSGIELLKIFAIILIVISHVVQTLREANPYISYSDYLVDLSVATTSTRNFILTLFSYFGVLGNSIFFICSAWFLLHSSKYSKSKWFFILFEVWFISVVIFFVTFLLRHGNLSWKMIITSCLPTTFTSNWYLTCYLLFYPIHPLLNSIIHKMSKAQLFRISAVLFILYCGCNFIVPDLFFSSRLILWITIYFVMAYLQLYMEDFMNHVRKNLIFLFVGLVGYIGMALIANVIGLHVSFMSNKVLRWITNCNPFLIAISIAAFNLMRQLTFKCTLINYISSLSLLIYIIHENIILRTYYRPLMWNYIYKHYGYDNLLVWVFVIAFLVFAFGLITSLLYDKALRPLVRKTSEHLYSVIRKYYLRLESVLLRIH